MKKLTMPIATTVPPSLAVRDRRADSARIDVYVPVPPYGLSGSPGGRRRGRTTARRACRAEVPAAARAADPDRSRTLPEHGLHAAAPARAV